jgi:hypothetical protein
MTYMELLLYRHHHNLPSDWDMANWQDRDFLRPLYALLTYGPMALMGDMNFGKTSPLSMVKLYTGIWHPTPRPDSDTLLCQLDLWKVIVKMVRFGHSEFINGISVCMHSWKHLPIFRNINTPYQIDPSRVWTKQAWNAACVRMQGTPHFEVMTCIRNKVRGTNSLYPKNNAKVSQSVLARIADIANAIEISDDEGSPQDELASIQTHDVDTQRESLDESRGSTTSDPSASNPQEDGPVSRDLDGNSGPSSPNNIHSVSNSESTSDPSASNPQEDGPVSRDLDGNSGPSSPNNIHSVSNSESTSDGNSGSTTANRLPDQNSDENPEHLQNLHGNSGDSTSDHVPDSNPQENDSGSGNDGKSTRKKRKRSKKGQDVSKYHKPPPKKRKKTAKTKSTNASSTISVYQQSEEAFSNSLFKLPVLVKSEPKVCECALCDCLCY